MKYHLNDDQPIYIQIKEHIEDSIIKGGVKAGERIPSTNEFAKYYNINPATAAKGVNELVAEGILLKKRGVGMFVTENAKSLLIEKRKNQFYEMYVTPLINEARRLKINKGELIDMIDKGGTENEN